MDKNVKEALISLLEGALSSLKKGDGGRDDDRGGRSGRDDRGRDDDRGGRDRERRDDRGRDRDDDRDRGGRDRERRDDHRDHRDEDRGGPDDRGGRRNTDRDDDRDPGAKDGKDDKITVEQVRRTLRDKASKPELKDEIDRLLEDYKITGVKDLRDEDLGNFMADLKKIKAPRAPRGGGNDRDRD